MAQTLPGIPIAYSPTFREEPRRRVVSFGDGYSLRSLDGLNAITMRASLQWRARPTQDMAGLRDFFRAHQGVHWFWWTPPGQSGALRWVCPQYSWTPVRDAPGYWDVDADLEQVHDLGT